MKLAIVRHADAGNREQWAKSGRSDDERPLSKKGHNQAKLLARTLQFLFKEADQLLTSPLVRARETAELLIKGSAKRLRLTEIDELKPLTDPAETLAKVKTYRTNKCVVLVGHEPHLSRFLSFILTFRGYESLDISKGSIALVDFDDDIEKGRGRLTCLLQPSFLKKIRKKKS